MTLAQTKTCCFHSTIKSAAANNIFYFWRVKTGSGRPLRVKPRGAVWKRGFWRSTIGDEHIQSGTLRTNNETCDGCDKDDKEHEQQKTIWCHAADCNRIASPPKQWGAPLSKKTGDRALNPLIVLGPTRTNLLPSNVPENINSPGTILHKRFATR